MFKIKKILLFTITMAFLMSFAYEMIRYIIIDSNIYGMIYNIISVFIIFFLVTVTYNYKKYFSWNRISKLIIVILAGIFSSFILQSIVLSNMIYFDSTKKYMECIFLTRVIIKPIIYFFILIFIIVETNLIKMVKKFIENKANQTNKLTKN